MGQPMQNVRIMPLAEAGRIAVRSEAVGLGYYPEPEPETLAPADSSRATWSGYRAWHVP